MKAIISIGLSQDKEAYMIKEAAGFCKGKRAKISIIIFPKTALCCRLGPLMYFIFLDNTLSIAVFTLIKLMFETQAAKL